MASRKPQLRSLGRAAGLSAVLIGAGTALGFARDLVLAHRFGASSSTDAFLVSWTIPETVSPLLIEDAMALIMVPAVTRMMLQPQGVRSLVRTALPRLALALALIAITVAAAAPLLVSALAPGLADPAPAVHCVRWTSVTILAFGIAGFMNATLRAHHCFGPPASIYMAYNIGILTAITALSAPLGITSAAIGVACGSVLMVAVQVPAFVTRLRTPAREKAEAGGADTGGEAAAEAARLSVAAILPIVVYTLTRQAQVLVERFLGSGLAAGSISHLNYAQKVAQVPMVLSLLIVTVTFPRLARASAERDTREIRHRIEADLVIVSGIVLCAVAYLTAFAPAIVQVLFQHGNFTADDTEGTSSVLRVYSLGLWGQSMLGVSARALFARSQPLWRPALAVAAGLGVTVVTGALLVERAGTIALAAGNAAGVTLSAVLLLAGVRARVVRISVARVGGDLLRLVAAAACGSAAGAVTAAVLSPATPPLLVLVAGAGVVASVFAAVLAATGRGRRPAMGLRALGGPAPDEPATGSSGSAAPGRQQ
ncbi:murein biosynthesis integral membrane protein MurJ [Actinomadura hibisca]|uniref:murein biosynthesis integral membrane protein MurJ n=1 Tax=Actinomadura hibisca TaxID=68565 RepID=UPI000A05126D|nr:lipid II flippase MurJ [Actinomadura hibisca]